MKLIILTPFDHKINVRDIYNPIIKILGEGCIYLSLFSNDKFINIISPYVKSISICKISKSIIYVVSESLEIEIVDSTFNTPISLSF